MDARLAGLLQLLELERLEVNIFRGGSRDIGSPQVYGGQVLGQALQAAYATVDADRVVHSLHAYFLRRGDYDAPIVYFVDRSREGHSFTSRRVTAVQHGEQIFHCSASFQRAEPGFEHQLAMPRVPPPEEIDPAGGAAANFLDSLAPRVRALMHERPIEVRRVPAEATPGDAPRQYLWIRMCDRLPDDDRLHRCLLAYASDFHLLGTALIRHERALAEGTLVIASIDHAMWFHHPARMDEWLLYAADSPSASGARGFVRGSLYTRTGRLVASTAQEGLVRVVPAATPAVPAAPRG
jgi:acyl-CoA thioesterase-2